MGISIKNQEVEQKIRRFAAVSGCGVTEAVELAIDEALARRLDVAPEERLRRKRAIDRLVDEVRSIREVDPRPIDDLLLDEEGLPI